MKLLQQFTICFLLSTFILSSQSYIEPPEPANAPAIPELVLIFSKTKGYRHQSIEKGALTLKQLGRANGFIVLQTETAADFNPDNLKNYKLVVFLSTTQDVLNDAQQKAFEGYIQDGGSFLGIHAATDTEYDWAWYGKLVGGYFKGHPNNPNVRKASIQRIDKTHISSAHLPDTWTRFDEWYNYKNLNLDMNVVLNLDESSYEGGTNGEHHPIAWHHEFDGGRAYYTGGGHTEESFDEPLFREHLLGAIKWCLKRE